VSETRLVRTDFLIPPVHPMRKESLYDGMEELKESLVANGLQQAIGAVELESGEYRIVWGMRRTVAAKELGWQEIECKVFQPGEVDEEMGKAHENFHRTNVDPIEEAEFFQRIITDNSISITECARRCRRSPSHVSRLLSLLEGHSDVREALRMGHINSAQAVEINRSSSAGWVKLALRYAQGQGITAIQLARWRDTAESSGEAANLEAVLQEMADNPPVDYRVQNKCHVHQDWLPVEQVPMRPVCNDCWDKLMLAAEHFVTCKWREEQPPAPEQPKPITEMSKAELLAVIESLHGRVVDHMP